MPARSQRGRLAFGEETSRKSPPASSSAADKRAVPYARESLGKVGTSRVLTLYVLTVRF